MAADCSHFILPLSYSLAEEEVVCFTLIILEITTKTRTELNLKSDRLQKAITEVRLPAQG